MCVFVVACSFYVPKVTEGVRAAVFACVEKSTNSESRIVEVNPFVNFFSKALGALTPALACTESICFML